MSQYVSGKDRPIYFKRPLVPQMTDMPIIVQQPRHDLIDSLPKQDEQEIIIEQKTKDQEIQTDYRESEAQTDPYTPKYIIRDDEKPEVLQLEHLTWRNKKLPASIDELEAIEAKREELWFSHSLPPISDEASFTLRRKLMEEQELRDWSKKESDIKKTQNEKLYLQQSALIEREKEVEEKNALRIEEIKIKKTEQKNRLIAKIQRRKIKVLRKMLKSRKALDQNTFKREIIEDYGNFASKVYAGITREGLSLDKIANKYEVQPVALTTFQGMQELADTIKPTELETKVNVKKQLKEIQKQYNRMENFHRIELRKAEQQIYLENNQPSKEDNKKDENADKKKYGARVRASTPTYKVDQDYNLTKYETILPIADYKIIAQKQRIDDKRYRAVMLLQRLIRGRFTQNIMYEGKDKRQALIAELLIVARIPDMEEEEKDEILMQNHEEKVKNATLESIQGEFISETLDQLSKELLRMKQEKKINKMVSVSENDRKLREIEEAGKRQAEEKLREREDVMYNEILRVHQGTVDTYLDWIFENTIEQASTRQATIMANLRRDKMNKPLEMFENKLSNNETIIKDLVHAFLIPNVQRSKLQRKIEIVEKRFNEAAKKSLMTTMQKASQIEQQKK